MRHRSPAAATLPAANNSRTSSPSPGGIKTACRIVITCSTTSATAAIDSRTINSPTGPLARRIPQKSSGNSSVAAAASASFDWPALTPGESLGRSAGRAHRDSKGPATPAA